ncbi:SDR family oxidoreductase [Nocardia macrotermitis]|uniref:Coniferyl-alcohol dehydrogenase n=1 Tax=Nocardia macrotermitis TaxID=2585198 RepID=A0A7K0CVR8_9NOCA|nr:SDR family oxidoreductase [Nocardia macrotermitis]MQY17610.1 Coniferyl-alcohol dehydrogenase [Nocardia macrotermitis]
MSAIDKFRYDGRRVLVVGGATGMGAAAAHLVKDLGAEVTVMDNAPVDYATDRVVPMDLRDPDSIDAAVDALAGPVHAVFAAAGIADGPDMMRANFIGHRHLLERLLAAGKLPRGAAICFISSVAGMGWENNLPVVLEFLDTPDYAAAHAWVQERESTGAMHYGFSKQAINAYVATRAYRLLEKGIRINAICPGPTDTPLARANADSWLTFAQDYRDATGAALHVPEQMGNAMVFLNSAAASGVSGITLIVDSGHAMSSLTGAYAPGKPLMDIITGRVPLG